MRSLETVGSEVLANFSPLGTEVMPLEDSAGRVLAEAVRAEVDLPPMDNSAMDGYAIRVADLTQIPTRLRVVGQVAAGQRGDRVVGPGEAVRIFTGAPLPTGADAVVMQEDTQLDPADPTTVEVQTAAKPWEFVRFRGEDVRRGSELVGVGIRLGAAQLALLAASGTREVTVYRRPRVTILVSGNELVPPGAPLAPGQIYESNGLMLGTLLRDAGAEVRLAPTVRDDPSSVESAILGAWDDADAVVTVGGASVGEADLMRVTLRRLGAEVFDGEVAMKPGKPFFWARSGKRRVLGLPGNPVSAFVTAVLLVLPAIRKLAGLQTVEPPTTPGVLAEPLQNGDRRRHFVRVTLDPLGQVRSAGVQASHRLASLAAADGLVEVPAETRLPQGSTVSVLRWDW